MEAFDLYAAAALTGLMAKYGVDDVEGMCDEALMIAERLMSRRAVLKLSGVLAKKKDLSEDERAVRGG